MKLIRYSENVAVDLRLGNSESGALLMSENDMITVSGHNPQLRDLPVTESEIKLAFLTLSNYIHIKQQLSYG